MKYNNLIFKNNYYEYVNIIRYQLLNVRIYPYLYLLTLYRTVPPSLAASVKALPAAKPTADRRRPKQ